MKYEIQGGSSLFTRDFFDSLLVETRYIDSKKPDTSYTVYGKKFSLPIMMAVSPLEDIHKNEITAIAGKAQKTGVILWVDTDKKEEFSEIVSTGVGTIRIIKPYADNKIIISQIEQAQEGGTLAVGIDISRSFDDRRINGSRQKMAMSPKTMEEIREFVSASSIPFIVKGILSERDAYKCIMAGVQGIVVSGNYEARCCSVFPLMALPDILNVVNGQIPVFVDCGIIDGMDAFKTLALGASAVFAGQVITEFISSESIDSVFEKISSMSDELKSIMAQTGCYNLSHMDKTVLRQIRMI